MLIVVLKMASRYLKSDKLKKIVNTKNSQSKRLTSIYIPKLLSAAVNSLTVGMIRI